MTDKNYSNDLRDIFTKELPSLSAKQEEYKSKLSQEEYSDFKRGLEYRISDENRKIRIRLSKVLMRVSIGWLAFTGFMFLFMGLGFLNFSDGSQMTFIACSLVEVFALWKISLQYFYKN